ncbi:PEP-CTERM sorting domain-containing protein [Mucisphaera sp.]|uniref:PEP-CTERM sorting domain-containing protein n=1 Tax=Mucisphaera sp. TaxID=2913024 RepID=UPI003D12A022
MSTARLLTSALAATTLTSAALASSPTGGFIAIGDIGNSTATSDTITFYSTDSLATPLFTVALPFETTTSNREDFSALTVNPTTGDVYVLAFDSGNPGDEVTSTGFANNQTDTEGDSDLYRIDFDLFYNDWVTNQGSQYVSYYTQTDDFFGDPILGGAPNPVLANSSLASTGIQKIGEVATSRGDSDGFFNTPIAFIDENTIVMIDDDSPTTQAGASIDGTTFEGDHEIRLFTRIAETNDETVQAPGVITNDVDFQIEVSPGVFETRTVTEYEGGFEQGTTEVWTSEIIGRVQGDGEGSSEPTTMFAYVDPTTGTRGVWIVEDDGDGDQVRFFDIDSRSYKPFTSGGDAFILDDNPTIDVLSNDGNADRIMVNPLTGDLLISESGFFETPQSEPSIITREVISYDTNGEILFGPWGFDQLDGNQPGDDDTVVTDGRYPVYDFVNNVVYFYDRDTPTDGGSFDGDWWALDLNTGQTTLVANDAGNFQIFSQGSYAGFFFIGDLPGLVGDFDLSGVLDNADVDLLVAAILASSTDSEFDLDGSEAIDAGDLTFWVETLFGSFLGDANLDGEVDLIDLSNLATNFNGPAGYAGGDFNADGTVDLIDLSILATNFGSTNTIPEPASLALLGLGALALTRRSH